MREPWFWRSDTLTASVISAGLSPLGALYNFGQRQKWRAAKTAPAPAPVICVGNATLGGVGKTPFAIKLHQLLAQEDMSATFLTRGYGGRLEGPAQVEANTHTATDVGDEALLLAARGDCWIARDRTKGAELAAESADAIIMDDGFQNPGLEKTFSFLLVDNADPVGNGLVFPAGPMREPLLQALQRADAVIAIKSGKDAPTQNVILDAVGDKRLFSAWLEPRWNTLPEKAVAFCGIGQPERFFNILCQSGVELAARYAFADHHAYSPAELRRLKRIAAKEGVPLLTTEKDYVRLLEEDQQDVAYLPVEMAVDDEAGVKKLMLEAIDRWRRHARPAP